jgi:tripartite-type tricarboxylate transporter receptor subunit TctC
MVARGPMILTVANDRPIKSLQELIAHAKANPGKLNYASSGNGSTNQFAAELLKSQAGIDMTHVPYKGAAPAMAAAMSGEVNLMFGPIAQGLPQVKAGRLKALGVTGPNPTPLLPGVKPLVEQGFPGLLVFNFYPVMVPAKTPDAVARKVHSGLKAVMSDAGVRTRLEAAGIEPVWDDAPQVSAALNSDRLRWSALAKRAGMQSPN